MIFYRNIRACVLWLFVGLLVACGVPEYTAQPAGNAPTPTVSPLFNASAPSATPVPIPTPTDLARPTAPAATPAPDSRIAEMPVYSDTLDSDWTLDHSWAMAVDARATTVAHTGKRAIAATPSDDYGALFFTLRKGAKVYDRDGVLGLGFWLNSGEEPIDPDNMVVTVLGSNTYPYWVPGDDSVKDAGRVTDGSPLFSETQLVFLGINRTIPARTWVEVVLWLDEREFDPDYEYVTGFYVKNGESLRQTFYVDDVRLFLLQNENEE